MRLYLAAAMLAASAAIANDDPFLKGEELQAEVQKSCSEGCITFNRDEIEAFEARLQQMIQARETAAFNAGKRYQAQTCASLI